MQGLQKIYQQIEQSDVFVFVMSPKSIYSEQANWEVDHAVKLAKRIIPVVCADVDYRDVRKELASLNWLFFVGNLPLAQPSDRRFIVVVAKWCRW